MEQDISVLEYSKFTNRQLADEVNYMPVRSDMSNSENNLMISIMARLRKPGAVKDVIVNNLPGPSKKSKKKCKPNSRPKKRS
jgi:hypothetical protein